MKSTGVLLDDAALRSRADAEMVGSPLGAVDESDAATVPEPVTVIVPAMFETVGSVIVCPLDVSDCWPPPTAGGGVTYPGEHAQTSANAIIPATR